MQHCGDKKEAEDNYLEKRIRRKVFLFYPVLKSSLKASIHEKRPHTGKNKILVQREQLDGREKLTETTQSI